MPRFEHIYQKKIINNSTNYRKFLIIMIKYIYKKTSKRIFNTKIIKSISANKVFVVGTICVRSFSITNKEVSK